MGSNPGRTIPKALKMVPVATLLHAQRYKASTGFSSPNSITKYRTTNLATLAKTNKSEKSPIIINVCIHRRTVWKTGSYAKYVILLKYRDYYYYYYYQELVQSEPQSRPRNQNWKQPKVQIDIIQREHTVNRMSSYFPISGPSTKIILTCRR